MSKMNGNGEMEQYESAIEKAHGHKIEHVTSDNIENVKVVAAEAKAATAKEHSMTVRQGLKAYRKAIGWSILLSSAVIMEGYDTILVCRVSLDALDKIIRLTSCRLGRISVSRPSTIHSGTRLRMELLPSPLLGKVLVCPDTSPVRAELTLIDLVTNGAYIGEILGLAATGYLVDWYGNKKVMTGATLLMVAFVSDSSSSK